MSTASYQHLEQATLIHQRSHAAHVHQAPRVTQQAIAALANHYWHVRGCPQGSPEEDWFQAERELRYFRLHG